MVLAVSVLRFLLGLVLLAASVPKLRQIERFERTIATYALLPGALVQVVARIVPTLEFVCGVSLLAGFALSLLAPVAAVLLVCFASAIAVNLLRGRRIDCGCTSRITLTPINWLMVVRNLVLATFAALASAQPGGAMSSWSDNAPAFISAVSVLMLLGLVRRGLEVHQRLGRFAERVP